MYEQTIQKVRELLRDHPEMFQTLCPEAAVALLKDGEVLVL